MIGKIEGSQDPDAWVIVGNHRDAWVYGAVDPSSGTAAMLEAVHGIGALLRQGWRPKRTIVFCSWDAEEEGLIGSTEWVEQQGRAPRSRRGLLQCRCRRLRPRFLRLRRALAQGVCSRRRPLRSQPARRHGLSSSGASSPPADNEHRGSNAPPIEGEEVHVGDLGSGSDFTPFLQHAGVPATDIGSNGPYGVYHSAFDDFAWFTQNADPHFLYLQEMARVLGLEALRMADADVLPYDYVAYAREISAYIEAAKRKAADAGLGSLDFAPAEAAAARLSAAAQRAYAARIRSLRRSGQAESRPAPNRDGAAL